VVLTKCDKLKAHDLTKILDGVGKGLRDHPAAFPQLITTSSVNNDGVALLRATIAGIE